MRRPIMNHPPSAVDEGINMDHVVVNHREELDYLDGSRLTGIRHRHKLDIGKGNEHCSSDPSCTPPRPNRRTYDCLYHPQRWSLAFILLLTFSIASICTLLINTAAVMYFSPYGRATTSLEDFPNLLSDSQSISQQTHHEYIPRVFFLSKPWQSSHYWTHSRAVAPLSTVKVQDMQPMFDDGHTPECMPMSDWQTKSFPNCNMFHEIDVPLLSCEKTQRHEQDLRVLGEGWFRTTWKWETRQDVTVLKTLRIEREFIQEYYELHRRDSVAMERLTWSKFVVDVFGYCGQSAINEIANFPHEGIKDLEKFDRRLRKKRGSLVNKVKMQIAISLAQGVADIHSIDGVERGATMVHYDLNPRNVALFGSGQPKINDFNIAEFLRYNPKTNRTCGFPNRMHQPWWRAPEEVSLSNEVNVNEKVDVFALGNILFHILTSHSPYGKMKAEFQEATRGQVLKGIQPTLPTPYKNDSDPVIVAFRQAMARCWEYDPDKRASAQEIVDILIDAYDNLVERMKVNTSTKNVTRAIKRH